MDVLRTACGPSLGVGRVCRADAGGAQTSAGRVGVDQVPEASTTVRRHAALSGRLPLGPSQDHYGGLGFVAASGSIRVRDGGRW